MKDLKKYEVRCGNVIAVYFCAAKKGSAINDGAAYAALCRVCGACVASSIYSHCEIRRVK